MTRNRLTAVLTLLLAATGLWAQSRVTVSAGHDGAVHDVVGRPGLPLAFSVGDDGALKVWDLEHDGLRFSWQVSHHPLTRVTVHPERTEVTVFVQEGVTTGRLVGLDWETGEELFSTPVDANPTYLAYSPQGTWLVYALPSFDSVFMLDARDGRRTSYLDDGFGIVSFVQMARSERNIMTYVPSRGELIYWQIRSGSELQTVSTRTRLDHLTLVDVETQRLLAAAGGDELVVVDNLTGETRATYPVAPIHGIAYDEQTDRILVLTEQLGRRTTLAFTYESGRLRRVFYTLQDASRDTRVVATAGFESTRAFIAGDLDGEVAAFDDSTGRRTVLGHAVNTRIVDVAITPGRLHLAVTRDDGRTELLSLVSDLFDESNRRLSASFIRDSRASIEGAVELRFTADANRLLVWGTDKPGTLRELIPPDSLAQSVYVDERGVPVTRVRASEAGPLVVHRDGTIVQVGSPGEEERFRYTAVGAQDAIWDPELGLLAAKTRSGSFDSSLIAVDPLTGETIAASTDAFLTTRLALDARSSTLFAIGLHGSQASPSTRLTQLTGRGFPRSTVLDEVDFETTDGDLLWDARERALLSSMRLRSVERYRSGRREALEEVERLHTNLTVGANLVAARNMDGTVTVWTRDTGEHVVDLYAIGPEWIAITREGRYLTSSGAAERYLTFLPAERTGLDLEDFRISLPFEP